MTERISFQETSEGFIDGLMKTAFYLKKSGLDPKLLELLNYRVSQINGCAYCLDMHHKEAIHLGESELRLHSLAAWRETPYYTDQERAALSLAEVLTLVPQREVEESVYEILSKFFSKAQIADLTLSIALINAWNRLNKTFRPIPGNYAIGQHGL
jgi:AhpD family alkylhydroperoxidase